MKRWKLVAALMFTIMLLTLSSAAFAESKKKKRRRFQDKISVLQRKPFLRHSRIELSLKWGFTFNDALVRQFPLSLNINYHITDNLFAGVVGNWFDFGNDYGGETSTYDAVVNATSAIPEISKITWFAGAEVGWVPLYGKFALFNLLVVHYDTHITAGVGAIQTSTPDPHFAGTLSIGQRFFLNKWLCFTLDLRDILYKESLPSGDSFYNAFTFNVGFSMFIPFSFEYTTRK